MTEHELIERKLGLMTLPVQEILPKELDPTERWWTFPGQGPVKGFLGTRPLMIIGDQPSTSSWPESHPSRKPLYGSLVKLGVADAHLTDVIKRRGKGSESRRVLPTDFPTHIDLLRREFDIVKPTRIVALGRSAEQLLIEYLPEVQDKVRRVSHFAYGARPGKSEGFVDRLRNAIV